MDFVVLCDRLVVYVDLLIFDLDLFSFPRNNSFDKILIQFLWIFKNNNISSLDLPLGEDKLFESIFWLGIDQLIHQQEITHQKSWLHRSRGYLEGLDDKGHHKKHKNSCFSDELKILSEYTFFAILLFFRHFQFSNEAPTIAEITPFIKYILLYFLFDVLRLWNYAKEMNFTLFGYPKSGKTTLFNLLTGANIEVDAYGTQKKEANLRTCLIPDNRLDQIWDIYPDKKKKPATVDYVDLCGMSFGDIKNEAYLNYLRKADGLTHVIRGYRDPQIAHPRGSVDAKRDILAMEEELLLADLLSIESRIDSLEKEIKRSKSPEGEREFELLQQLHSQLEEGTTVREANLSPSEEKLLRGFALLTQKSLFHMINVDEDNIAALNQPESIYATQKTGTAVLAYCGSLEKEISELEGDEKESFLKEYGLAELSSQKFLKTSYDLLEVITFFTIGKAEVKAWTIKKNSPAVFAAGLIHSDIEKGFIRAEVIPWNELLKAGSFLASKEQAAVRLEGKNYIIQDGDVIQFRFAK